jgi:hypothetical protein
MTCYGCESEITDRDAVNNHHVKYRSKGGKRTKPMHADCHVGLHSDRNDFREWGRMGGRKSAQDGHWSFFLVNVRTHRGYNATRQSYTRTKGYTPTLEFNESHLTDQGWQKAADKLTVSDLRADRRAVARAKRITVTIGDVVVLLKGRGQKFTSR